MTRTELIERLIKGQAHLNEDDVELAVKTMLDQMSTALAHGERIEIRGFGAFSLRRRESRVGRNPKTGETIMVAKKHIPYFRAGKELRERVNPAAAA
jgi:integration host factor subunit beta